MTTIAHIETTDENIAAACKLLNARPIDDGRYVYRADETGTDWAVDESDLVQVLAYAEDGKLTNEPYSRWCADTSAQELEGE